MKYHTFFIQFPSVSLISKYVTFLFETSLIDDMQLSNYYYSNGKRHPFTMTVNDVHVCCYQLKKKDFLLIKSNFNKVLELQNLKCKVIHKIGLPENEYSFFPLHRSLS